MPWGRRERERERERERGELPLPTTLPKERKRERERAAGAGGGGGGVGHNVFLLHTSTCSLAPTEACHVALHRTASPSYSDPLSISMMDGLAPWSAGGPGLPPLKPLAKQSKERESQSHACSHVQ